jgi:hypothetical protein
LNGFPKLSCGDHYLCTGLLCETTEAVGNKVRRETPGRKLKAGLLCKMEKSHNWRGFRDIHQLR